MITEIIFQLQQQASQRTPNNPMVHGWASYSQCDEDGIIRECLNRIGKTTPLSRSFVEIGCGNGKENNTHQLLLDGFFGYWVDGSAENIQTIAYELGGSVFTRLRVLEKIVDANTAPGIADNANLFLDTDSIDFFSLDIDGNDIHVFKPFINTLNPKLVCVEYNAKFPPPTAVSISYNDCHTWAEDDYFGASLQAWVNHLRPAGYSLVSCNASGANAFFVRNDLLAQFSIYNVEELYQPPRYHLVDYKKGHSASLKWLEQSLAASATFSQTETLPARIGARMHNEVVAKTPTGHMLVYKEDQIIGRSLLETGSFQEDKISEVATFLSSCHQFQPELFVDIGANIGTHSIFCLKNEICKTAISFEPDPFNYHLLRRNTGANDLSGRSTLYQLALSEKTGEIEMELSNYNFGDHRIKPASTPNVSFGEETERANVSVSSITLDELANKFDFQWNKALVWIDTQGHEGSIFKGASRFLFSNSGPVFLVTEFWPYGIERSGSKQSYFQMLRACTRIYDINKLDWQNSAGVSIESLMATYGTMLAHTEKEHHPHTDLLLVLKSTDRV
jgi:FkbM family methyltransferase